MPCQARCCSTIGRRPSRCGALVRAFPDARAICVMPNHVHLLVPDDRGRERLSVVRSAYARWRGHARRQGGPGWSRQPAAPPLTDPSHVRRSHKYILLNPCRGQLADDPLARPLSLHRDLVGLGDAAWRVRDPEALHRYVSANPTVSLVGTQLPCLSSGPASFAAIEAAVGAVLRMRPEEALVRARRLLVRAAWYRENTDIPAVGAWVRASRATVYRLIGDPPTRSAIVEDPSLYGGLRAVDDPRFGPLVSRGRRTTWAQWRVR